MRKYRCYICNENFILLEKGENRCPLCYSKRIKNVYLIEHAIKNDRCVGCGEYINYEDFYDSNIKMVYFESGLCILCQKERKMK